jgi:nucleoid DNA-binding protein
MNEIVLKGQLDGQVAALLGKKTSEISGITAAFLHEIVGALVEQGAVHLAGLGTLHVSLQTGNREAVLTNTKKKDGTRDRVRVKVRRKYYVIFKRACALRNALKEKYGKEEVMEKYGVDESADKDLEKQAAEGCPVCGKKPERHGKVLMCPQHGSEPFESPQHSQR